MSEQEVTSADFRNGRKSFRDRDCHHNNRSILCARPCCPRTQPHPGGAQDLLQNPRITIPARKEWIEVRNPMSSPPLTPRDTGII